MKEEKKTRKLTKEEVYKSTNKEFLLSILSRLVFHSPISKIQLHRPSYLTP